MTCQNSIAMVNLLNSLRPLKQLPPPYLLLSALAPITLLLFHIVSNRTLRHTRLIFLARPDLLARYTPKIFRPVLPVCNITWVGMRVGPTEFETLVSIRHATKRRESRKR